MVSWWQAEGNAYDSIGNNNGTLQGGIGFASGKVGQAFVFNNTNADVLIPASSSLNVGAGSGFTLEAWVDPTNLTAGFPLFEWNVGNGTTPEAVQFYVSIGTPNSTQPSLYADVVDTGGNLLAHRFWSSGGEIHSNVFQHVALTYDKASGQAMMYCNGVVVGQANLGSFTPLTTYNLYLGRRLPTLGETYTLPGFLDEPSIYNRALSSNEIVAIYNAGSAGKCFTPVAPTITTQPTNPTVQVGGTATFNVAASGTQPLSYQWFFNGTALVASNIITTVVGNHSLGAGYSGDGGAVTNAALHTPFCVTMDGANNLYIADSANNVIRKVSASGIITTVAGNHSLGAGYSGDGGAATDAAMNYPVCVAVDGAGNLYISDYGNAVVRKVDTNGVITTVAGNHSVGAGYSGDGGAATNAALNYPFGIVVDGSGNLYIADSQNSLVRKVNTGGVITTVVGNHNLGAGYSGDGGAATNATLHAPDVVAVDKSGNLYFSDFYNNVVREVNTNGIITTVAGNHSLGAGYSGDGGAAANATLNEPNGVFVDSSGNLYIADQGNNVVREVNTNGIITTVAGNHSLGAGYSGDGGAATNAAMNNPTGVDVDGSGNLYIADAVNNVIRKVTPVYNTGGNGTLTLANVQLSQAGNYSVLVSNIAGSTNSTSATLTVNVPVCTPAPSGLVSWWPGEGNANDSIGGNNGTLINGTGSTNGEVGQAFNLNGVNNYVLINPTSPSSLDVGQGVGFTIECWIKTKSVTKQQLILEYERVLGTGNGSDVGIDFAIQPSTQLYANIVDTNDLVSHEIYAPANLLIAGVWQHVALTYDKASGNAAIYINGNAVTQANLGSFTPQTSFTNLLMGARTTYGSASSPNTAFSGAIDELSVYSRALTQTEIQAIYNAGSAGKCFTPVAPSITTQPTNQTVLLGGFTTFTIAVSGTGPLSYQWSFNGTNIVGATSPTLALSNVQLNQAGNYSVQVSNIVGSTNSTSAMLTIELPPVITQQPESQSVVTYSNASFTVAATGTGPLSYQWQFNGTNLVDGGNVNGSATTNLNLTSVSLASAGSYTVIVSNPYATTNSAVAVLTVPQTVMSMVSTNAMSGSTVMVPVLMNAVGAENAFQASVGYDPTKLVLQSVQPGPAAAGVFLQEVDSQTNNGYVGFVILLNTGSTQPAGNNEEVADLVFSTLPVTNNETVNLTYGDNPIPRQVVNNNGDSLPAIYQNATVSLTPAEYAADVYPRPTGDHQVGLSDWVEIGKMVAGLDTPTNSDEMLRADCAPRNAPDGVLTVADWVQAGRYEYKLDPLTLVTLPPAPSPASLNKVSLAGLIPTRTLQLGSISVQRGQTATVPVQLISTTNENAAGMTVGFDTGHLKFLGATLGSSIIGGRLNVNTNTAGEIGVALAMSPGLALSAGTNQVALLQFVAATNASGPAALSLNSSVVQLQLADKSANVLPANYVNGVVTLPPQPVVTTSMTGGSGLQMSWQIASGSFQVQSATSPTGPWTNVPSPTIVTNGANASVTVTVTNQQQYYRLVGQ